MKDWQRKGMHVWYCARKLGIQRLIRHISLPKGDHGDQFCRLWKLRNPALPSAWSSSSFSWLVQQLPIWSPCLWALPPHTPYTRTCTHTHRVSVLPIVDLLKTNSDLGTPLLPTAFGSSLQVWTAHSDTGWLPALAPTPLPALSSPLSILSPSLSSHCAPAPFMTFRPCTTLLFSWVPGLFFSSQNTLGDASLTKESMAWGLESLEWGWKPWEALLSLLHQLLLIFYSWFFSKYIHILDYWERQRKQIRIHILISRLHHYLRLGNQMAMSEWPRVIISMAVVSSGHFVHSFLSLHVDFILFYPSPSKKKTWLLKSCFLNCFLSKIYI